MRIYITLFICILLAVHPQDSFAQDNYSMNRWEVKDLEFKYKPRSGNPFNIEFGAKFTHESGHTTRIPGFYDDEDSWIIRFCPSLEGTWNFETYASIPSLSGKNGKVEVGPKQKADEHGAIVVSKDNPQKFEYEDGSPYFLLAYELDWLFALDWDNKHDIPRSRKLIDEVVKNGFNHVVMNVYAYDANWGERDKIDPRYNFAEPTVFPFAGTNEKPDYSTLNIDFFKHLDRVIAYMDDAEIVAHLMIYVWNKNVNWPEPESDADNMYFDYVVKRYQAYPNLVWDISKEALAYGRDDMSYITRRIDRLRKLDGHGRLLSVHDYSYCNAFPDKVDFISIQTWRANLYNVMLDVKKRHGKKPIFNIEHGGYEKSMHYIFKGAYEDAVACLDRNYLCVFAGTYSTYYWQNTSWYEVVYDPMSLSAESQPKFHFYKNLSKLFSKFDFSTLEPTQGMSSTYCISDREEVYLFYVPRDMISLQGGFRDFRNKEVQITWFDPFTGEFHASENQRFGNGAWTTFKRHEEITAPFCVAVVQVID